MTNGTGRGKRSLLREIGNPLSLLHEKNGEGKSTGEWSNIRVITITLLVWFVWTSPTDMNGPSVALVALIVFALPVRDLFRRVPAAEVLGALQAFFGNVMGKAAASLADVRKRLTDNRYSDDERG